MIYDVVKYTQKSEAGIEIPYYRIIEEDEESFDNFVKELDARGIDYFEMFGVDIVNCEVNYADGIIRFPRWGVRCHISTVLTNEHYGTVVSRGFYKVKEYLND